MNGPYDMGYDSTTNTHRVRAEQSDITWNTSTQSCNLPSSVFANGAAPAPGCTGEFCCGGNVEFECRGLQGDFIWGNCECNFSTPILLDMNGDGFRLTTFDDGVLFDLTSTGILRQMSWTAAGSDDAFLFLDRNNNGTVDGGVELFGNYTPTPDGPTLNGFVALAAFDRNLDGRIDASDSVFADLQLWTDRNHDGRSQPAELVRLADTDVSAISVDFRESRRQDRFGNLFRYRAPVIGAGGPFAYDVSFSLTGPAASMTRRVR